MSAQPTDTGFANPTAARRMVRRIRLKVALRRIAAANSAALDLLDHNVEPKSCARATVSHGCRLHSGVLDSRLKGLVVDAAEGKDVREDQLLEGVDLILQFFDTLGVGLGHGLFSVEGAPDSMTAVQAGHRLSEASK